MLSSRTRFLVVAFATGSLVLAACAGETATPPDSPSPTAPTATASPTPDDGPQPCDSPGECEPATELIEAAQAEGEVTLYSSVAIVLQEQLAEAFEAKYGIRVNFQQIGDPDQIQKVTAEVESGRVSADISQHTTTAAYAALSAQGAFAELTPEEVPNLISVLDDPTQFRETFAFWGGVGYVMAWNNERVADADAPESWCDLTDPAYRGRIGAVDVPGSLSVYAHYAAMEQVCGDGYLEAMADQQISYYPNISSLNPAVAAGEVEIAMHAMPHVVNPLIAEGAPITWEVRDGMGVAARFFGVLADAPNPNAARLLANFLLSREAQEIAFGDQQGLSVLGPSVIPDAIQLPDTRILADSEQLPEDLQATVRAKLGLE